MISARRIRWIRCHLRCPLSCCLHSLWHIALTLGGSVEIFSYAMYNSMKPMFWGQLAMVASSSTIHLSCFPAACFYKIAISFCVASSLISRWFNVHWCSSKMWTHSFMFWLKRMIVGNPIESTEVSQKSRSLKNVTISFSLNSNIQKTRYFFAENFSFSDTIYMDEWFLFLSYFLLACLMLFSKSSLSPRLEMRSDLLFGSKTKSKGIEM